MAADVRILTTLAVLSTDVRLIVVLRGVGAVLVLDHDPGLRSGDEVLVCQRGGIALDAQGVGQCTREAIISGFTGVPTCLDWLGLY
jgi:hypothetical protein